MTTAARMSPNFDPVRQGPMFRCPQDYCQEKTYRFCSSCSKRFWVIKYTGQRGEWVNMTHNSKWPRWIYESPEKELFESTEELKKWLASPADRPKPESMERRDLQRVVRQCDVEPDFVKCKKKDGGEFTFVVWPGETTRSVASSRTASLGEEERPPAQMGEQPPQTNDDPFPSASQQDVTMAEVPTQASAAHTAPWTAETGTGALTATSMAALTEELRVLIEQEAAAERAHQAQGFPEFMNDDFMNDEFMNGDLMNDNFMNDNFMNDDFMNEQLGLQ